MARLAPSGSPSVLGPCSLSSSDQTSIPHAHRSTFNPVFFLDTRNARYHDMTPGKTIFSDSNLPVNLVSGILASPVFSRRLFELEPLQGPSSSAPTGESQASLKWIVGCYGERGNGNGSPSSGPWRQSGQPVSYPITMLIAGRIEMAEGTVVIR